MLAGRVSVLGGHSLHGYGAASASWVGIACMAMERLVLAGWAVCVSLACVAVVMTVVLQWVRMMFGQGV